MITIRQEKRDLFRAKQGIDKPIQDKQCPICRNEFTDKEYLEKHMVRKHPEYVEEESDEDGSEFEGEED